MGVIPKIYLGAAKRTIRPGFGLSLTSLTTHASLIQEDRDSDSSARSSMERPEKSNVQLPVPAAADIGPTSDPLRPELELLDSGVCGSLLKTLLRTYYTPLETWYLRTIIDKAHRVSSPEESVQPPQTTTPDDVFYVLKLVLTRLISTASVDNVERTMASIKAIIERDFVGVIRRKLDEVYSGKHSSGQRAEKADRESRSAFAVSPLKALLRGSLGTNLIIHFRFC
jgi:hypothetical protein